MVAQLAACSSSTPPGAVNGNIRNKPFVVADSIAMESKPLVEIALASSAGACGATTQHPGETALILMLSDYASGAHTAPTAPGVYPVTDDQNAPKSAVAEGNILDGSCVNVADNDAVAIGGSVTLTYVENGSYTGVFDLTFDSGDHVTGSFDAAACTTPKVTDPTCSP